MLTPMAEIDVHSAAPIAYVFCYRRKNLWFSC